MRSFFLTPPFVLLLVAFYSVTTSYSTNYIAVANGNWSSAATWSIGRAPADNDSILIPTGVTVSVDINSPVYLNMAIYVQGTIDFQNGQKINMCPGLMMVFDSGSLTGGNPGSKVNICGVTEWNGPGPTPGPFIFSSGSSDPTAVRPTAVQMRSDAGMGTARVAVSWIVPSEEPGTSYRVMQSKNGLSFDEIGMITGEAAGNTAHQYQFIDEHAVEGTNYYRIDVIRNGQEFISGKTASASITNEQGCKLNVFPNPCVSDCQVSFTDCSSDNDGTIEVQMIDANGSLVSSTIAQQDASGAFTLNLDRSNNLAPGVYIVRGVSSKKTYQQKAILK